MANHASAAKRNRQRLKRTARNRALRSSLRTTLRKARAAIDTGEVESARELVKAASVALAKAASKGLIHRNSAARTTSRLAVHLHKLGSSAAQ